MWKRLFGLFAALALVVAVGCSDSDPEEADTDDTSDTSETTETTESTTTTAASVALEDWIAQADEICAAAGDDIDALGEPTTADELAELLPGFIEIATSEHADLEGLGEPEEEAEAVTELLDLAQQRIDLLQQAADDIEAGGDPQEVVNSVATEIDALQAQAADVAADLGLVECADAGTSGTSSTTSGGGTEDVPTTGDAAIDAMLQDCAAGNGVACDQAYALTEVGSDAEAFADTCGGTEESGTICASILGGSKIEPGQTTGTTYGDDEAFDAYYDNCGGGDMAQCDLLYLTSPIGSEYEEYGGTCGGTFSKEDSPFSCVTGE